MTCEKIPCPSSWSCTNTPGPGLREAGGKNLVGDGGAGSLGAATGQHEEPAVQRQCVGAATVSDVEMAVASFVFQISLVAHPPPKSYREVILLL